MEMNIDPYLLLRTLRLLRYDLRQTMLKIHFSNVLFHHARTEFISTRLPTAQESCDNLGAPACANFERLALLGNRQSAVPAASSKENNSRARSPNANNKVEKHAARAFICSFPFCMPAIASAVAFAPDIVVTNGTYTAEEAAD